MMKRPMILLALAAITHAAAAGCGSDRAEDALTENDLPLPLPLLPLAGGARGGPFGEMPEIPQTLAPLPGTAETIEELRRAAIADRSAVAPRIELARLWLEEDAATQHARFCPMLRTPQGDDGPVQPVVDPRATDGEACLEARSSPCEPRISARQVLEHARRAAAGEDLETIAQLLARAGALDRSRAELCSVDGLTARFGPTVVLRSSSGAERALVVHDPRAVGVVPAGTSGSSRP
jgi:hypothetical protein